VTRYEQQGCYSPHVVYVERGGTLSPREFAQHLASELAALARQHPRRALGLAEAAAVAGWREAAEMRALQSAGHELMGHAGGATPASAPAAMPAGTPAPVPAGWSVAYADQPLALAPSAGWRCIQVVAVDSLEQAVTLIAPHALFLQTAAVAVGPAALYPLAERLAEAGITRITALGRMTAPEAGWHHDGGFNLASLVRMVDLEMAAERAADRLAPYAQEDAP
jgi:hypothetical protein